VAAINSDKNIASFSTRNNQVDVAAPGVRVLSTTSTTNCYGQEVNRLSVDGAVYEANWINGAGHGSSSGVLVDGGICDAVGSSWSGKVVLCKRGTVSFATKVTNAKSGGGIAAVIYNNVAGNFFGRLNGVTSIIPAISLSLEDGQALIANNKIGLEATVISTCDALGPYAYFNGTSMAAPHVSGVAALVWSAKPSATNIEVREALIATAEDLGTPGRDDLYGHGLVKAKKAIDYLTSMTKSTKTSKATNEPTVSKAAKANAAKGKVFTR
jgi:subtilisin family serine protease